MSAAGKKSAAKRVVAKKRTVVAAASKGPLESPFSLGSEIPLRGWALVAGSSSEIGRAFALRLAKRGYGLVLWARDAEEAALDAKDFHYRTGANCVVEAFDARAETDYAARVARLPSPLRGIAVAFGDLGDEGSFDDPGDLITVNFTAAARLLAAGAERLVWEKKARPELSPWLIGISSVAGERGRASNYPYGAAKAGLTAFLSGLRGRLLPQGVFVMTVLPGFVRTRMIEGIRTPKPITALPAEVAEAMMRALDHRRPVIWVRPIWRLIMAVVVHIPEKIFNRLKF